MNDYEIKKFEWEPARFVLIASTLLFSLFYQPLGVSSEVADRSVRIAIWIIQIAPSFIFAIISGAVIGLFSLIFTKDKTRLFFIFTVAYCITLFAIYYGMSVNR